MMCHTIRQIPLENNCFGDTLSMKFLELLLTFRYTCPVISLSFSLNLVVFSQHPKDTTLPCTSAFTIMICALYPPPSVDCEHASCLNLSFFPLPRNWASTSWHSDFYPRLSAVEHKHHESWYYIPFVFLFSCLELSFYLWGIQLFSENRGPHTLSEWCRFISEEKIRNSKASQIEFELLYHLSLNWYNIYNSYYYILYIV